MASSGFLATFVPFISPDTLADILKPYLGEILQEVIAVLETDTDPDILRNALYMLRPFLVESNGDSTFRMRYMWLSNYLENFDLDTRRRFLCATANIIDSFSPSRWSAISLLTDASKHGISLSLRIIFTLLSWIACRYQQTHSHGLSHTQCPII